MADATDPISGPAPDPTPAPKPAPIPTKKARLAAAKELDGMFKLDRSSPSFDHERFWELHYLKAGKPVPNPDEAGLLD